MKGRHGCWQCLSDSRIVCWGNNQQLNRKKRRAREKKQLRNITFVYEQADDLHTYFSGACAVLWSGATCTFRFQHPKFIEDNASVWHTTFDGFAFSFHLDGWLARRSNGWWFFSLTHHRCQCFFHFMLELVHLIENSSVLSCLTEVARLHRIFS